MWIDPSRNLIFIFLANRINPSRDNSAWTDLDIRPALFSATERQHIIKVECATSQHGALYFYLIKYLRLYYLANLAVYAPQRTIYMPLPSILVSTLLTPA